MVKNIHIAILQFVEHKVEHKNWCWWFVYSLWIQITIIELENKKVKYYFDP